MNIESMHTFINSIFLQFYLKVDNTVIKNFLNENNNKNVCMI